VAQSLGAFGAVTENVEQLVGGQVAGERGEPNLQVGRGRMFGGDFQPFRVAAGDADGCAMQVVADDAHLPIHGPGIERFAGAGSTSTGGDEAGVVGDAPASHTWCLSDVPPVHLTDQPAARSAPVEQDTGGLECHHPA
jgi:hypothetical protein